MAAGSCGTVATLIEVGVADGNIGCLVSQIMFGRVENSMERGTEYLYIAMVDTPGFFAFLIRRFLKQKYVHVVVGMDRGLEEAYSFGRRNPHIPFFAGFEKEDKERILRAFPMADYRICELSCTREQKQMIEERLHRDYERRHRTHYAVLGLPFILWGIPFYQKNHYTCSSYIARVLGESGICVSKKHFSLVTPKDFCEYRELRTVYEGSLAAFVEQERTLGSTRHSSQENREAVYVW